jgi:hypothetical protein
MTEILNGKSHGGSPYASWVIVIQGGRTFIGNPVTKVDGTGTGRNVVYLSPVFEIQDVILPTPNGPFIGQNMRPVLEVSHSSVGIHLAELDKEDFNGLVKAIAATEENAKMMRSQKSGLTLAHSMPAKPPTPFRR